MNEIGVMNLVLIALVLIVLSVLIFLILKLGGDKEGEKQKSLDEVADENSRLDDLLFIVSRRSSSKSELSSAAIEFVRKLPFPKKESSKVPENAKEYLNFILLLASHKNTDAKLIAFVNKELKKRNPSYIKEIDIYEDQGIRQRKNRS